MKKKIIAMLAAMMCLASSSLSYSSVAIAANSLNSNDIAEVKITSSDLKECNLVTESKNDGCWINLNLKSGVFAMSGNARQSFSIIGSFERKDNDLYLYPENASAEFYVLHREKDHFVSQSDEIGVQLKAGLVFYADNDAFWEILLDWTLSGNEPSNTGETAEQNTSFIMGDVNDDGVFSVSDVVLLQKWLLAVPDTHLENWRAANFCDDDRLDVFDLTLMKRAMIYGETGQPISPTTQPIGLNRTEEVIELLKNYDLNNYNEAYRKSLSKMFERFNEDGYFYHFADSNNKITLNEDQTNASIWLMPYSNLEDTGILYHVAYQGKYYQVYYYFTDPAYTASDLWDYMEQRLRIKNINVVDEKYGIVDYSNEERIDMSAYFAIDDTHYCKVKTYEPEDALMDFLQGLNYEKLDIANNTSTDPITPVAAQPISYKDMDSAIDAIKKCDISAYPNTDREDYRKIFDRFQNDGFIYQVTDNDLIKTNTERGTTLFPYAKYEDIGVGFFVTFKGNNYHILFYSADADVLAETDGIAAYLKKRMGRNSDKEITVSDKTVSLLLHENGQCYANAFVDENHYFDVIGAVSEEEMTEFLNAFTYEKTVF